MVQFDDNRQSQAEKPAPPVAVVGAGSIGTGFTVVFAMAGRRVQVYDPSGEKRQAVRPRIAEIIRDLREFELIGQEEDAVLANVLVVDELTDALDDVEHVQECGPEQLDLKRELFVELDKLAPQNAVLASSSSAIPSSQFAAGLECASRCLVVHPANPPFLIRVVEVVPSAVTS